MNKTTFNLLHRIWIYALRNKYNIIDYNNINTHFQSVEVNMLHQLGYIERYSNGVKATEKCINLTSEDLYKIKTI